MHHGTVVVAYTVFLLAAGFSRHVISANYPSSPSRPCEFEKVVAKTGREPRVGTEHDFDLIYRYGTKYLQAKGVPSHDAEDILQNVMVRLMRSEAGYKGESEYTSWISSVLNKAQVDFYRSTRKGKSLGVSLDATNDDGGPLAAPLTSKESAPESSVSVRDEARQSIPRVREAIRNLQSDFRMAYLLYAEGMSSQAVGQRLGVQSGTARTRVFRAHAVLEATLSLALDRTTAGLLKEGAWKPEALPADAIPRDAEQAMGLLEEQRRLILAWHEIFGLSLNDVARMLARAPKEVAREHRLAKDELNTIIGKHGLGPPPSEPKPAETILSTAPSNLEEAIERVAPVHRTVLRLRYLDDLEYSQIKSLPQYTGDANVSRKVKLAERALAEVLAESQLVSPNTMHLFGSPKTLEETVRAIPGAPERAYLRLAVLEGLTHNEIIARLGITRMGAHTQRQKALEAFKQITTRYELPYRLELKGGQEKPRVWTADEP